MLYEVITDGVPVTITGFGKGSGMIQPDMATTLNFVFTDANLPADVLQDLLKDGADKSYNCITVDSDTSTSDTLLLVATRAAAHKPVKKAGDKALKKFKKALDALLVDLAQQIVKDGVITSYSIHYTKLYDIVEDLMPLLSMRAI